MQVSSDKVIRLRKHHGWSQERLAQISGLSPRTIQRVEQGEPSSIETRLSLANAFNVTPSELDIDVPESSEASHGGLNYSGITGLILGIGLMAWQFFLPTAMFFDLVSVLLTVGLVIAMAAISLGLEQTVKTLLELRWVVLLPKPKSTLTDSLPNLQKLIFYCYSAGSLSTLVGVIAVLMTPASLKVNWPYPPKDEVAMGLGIAALTLLYGMMLAELVFRPLKHCIERLLIAHCCPR